MGDYRKFFYSKEYAHNNGLRFFWLDDSHSYPYKDSHLHDYHEVFLFLKGGGNHTLNFKDYEIQDFSLHILAPNQVHCINRDNNLQGFFVTFKNEYLHKLSYLYPDIPFIDFYIKSQVLNFSYEEYKEFKNLIQELKDNRENTAYMDSLAGLFLTKIVLQYNSSKKAFKYNSLVDKLMMLVNLHYKNQLNTAKYAELLNTSTSNLRRIVKKHTGKTVKELQKERLLREAKRLLYNPKYDISELAYRLGFKQPAHFSAWFKKMTSKSPSDYREFI